MDFVAMDFETASAKRASACSLALTIVKQDKIVDEFYSLINPQTEFNWRNIQVHGIHEQDVKDAPTFPELWEHIHALFSPDQLVVAHNAPFDNSVLRKSLEFYDLPAVKYFTLDTVRTSRQLLPGFSNYKLNTVCSELDIDLEHHHNALDDAQACANILIYQSQHFGATPLKQFIKPIR